MEFHLSPTHLALRDRIRRVIAETVDDAVIEEAHRSGTNHSAAFARALGAEDLLAEAMPGEGRDPLGMWLLSSETEKAGAPFDSVGMSLVVAGVLSAVGSEWQRERVVGGLLSGEEVVCFGLTEPDGGSDLAAMKTRATRDGDQWVINGAKMWTTMAHIADWVFLMARTESEGESARRFHDVHRADGDARDNGGSHLDDEHGTLERNLLRRRSRR